MQYKRVVCSVQSSVCIMRCIGAGAGPGPGPGAVCSDTFAK